MCGTYINHNLYVNLINFYSFGKSLESPSLNAWVQDLRWMTELECMSILQGKPIAVPMDTDQTSLQVQAYRGIIFMIKKIR